MTRSMVYVNRAHWDGPDDLPSIWAIRNAPRPLPGLVRWQGTFRAGAFYAAGPADDAELVRAWDALDAAPVELIDNAEIERRVHAHVMREGYLPEALDAMGITTAMVAADMGLPYLEAVP